MALSFLMVFAATVILIRPETPVTKVQTCLTAAGLICVFVCVLSGWLLFVNLWVVFPMQALRQDTLECCSEKQKVNSSCSNDTHCEPGKTKNLPKTIKYNLSHLYLYTH